jgi:hypothetical protein
VTKWEKIEGRCKDGGRVYEKEQSVLEGEQWIVAQEKKGK